MEVEANIQLLSCSTCSYEFSLLLTQTHGIQCCHPLKVLLDANITPCNPKNELALGNHGALYSADCAEQDKTVYTPPFGCYLAVGKV